MSKIPFLLIFILAVASLPVINNWLSHRSQNLNDDYIGERLDNYISKNFDRVLKALQEESAKNSVATRPLQSPFPIFVRPSTNHEEC